MAKEIDFPPVWLAGFAALCGAIGAAVPVHSEFNHTVGAVLVSFGLIVMAIAALQMLVARTTVIPRRWSTAASSASAATRSISAMRSS